VLVVRIGIIVGSTRPGRRGRIVAEWVAAQAALEQPAVGFDIVDLADVALPMLDEHHDFTRDADADGAAEFMPVAQQRQALAAMLDDVVAWSRALTQVRGGAPA
jgi:hypothetical protein